MAENTKIEWADHTFNPWVGCQSASPEGCKNCYAEALVKRFGGDFAERRRTSEANWKLPLKWNAQAQREGRRFRVFCASLADVFDNQAPVQWRRDLFDLIAATPHLDWLLLTKRIGNARSMYAEAYLDSAREWPANVWIGATVVNQVEAERDVPKLLDVPVRVRFLSIEPMLGAIDLANIGRYTNGSVNVDALRGIVTRGILAMSPSEGSSMVSMSLGQPRIHWVICGGESGPHARPMNPDWVRSLRNQCVDAGVRFLFKQWGEWGEPDSIERTGLARHGWWELSREDGGAPRTEWPGPVVHGVELASLRPEVFRVGKKAAGRLLDGVVHDGFPGL